MRAIGLFQSTDSSRSSIAEMERAFVDFCSLNLHQPVATFDWESTDGDGPNATYEVMISYVKDSGGEFLVVVPGAAHLGSDLEAVARKLVQLYSLGSKAVCYDDEFPDPLQNAFQSLGVQGVSRTRSDRIRESMRARALHGQALGRPMHGYHIGPDGRLEIVPAEAAVVELIFRLYTRDGLGLRLIVQHLNDRGIGTRRGGSWNLSAIRDMLKNPAYIGTYTRLGMRRPGAHAAIIEPGVFRAAQEQTRARRPVGRVVRSEPFLLSGGVHCGYCGNKMMGVTRRQSWKRKNGRRTSGVYRYYQCQSKNNQSRCGYHTWREPDLERAVLGELRYALLERQVSARDGGAVEGRREARSMREKRVKNAEQRLLRATRRAARGDLAIATLGRYLSELDAARKGASDDAGPSDARLVLDRWDSLDSEERRSFLAEHVLRITATDDRVVVVV